jgi:sec-independent protein translocase protein TatC
LSEKRPDEKVATIWEHIDELKHRAKWVVYSILATTSFFMVCPTNTAFLQNPLAIATIYDPLIALVLKMVVRDALPKGVTLIAGNITAPLEVYFIGSFILGLAASTPVIAYEVYRYIDPALYPAERHAIFPFIASFTALFVIGAVFGYKILVPFMLWAMLPFFGIAGANPIIYVTDFYQLVFMMTLATGFIFTLPVFFVLLVRFGIIKTSFVTTRRRYIYAALYILATVLTPDGGVLGDIALFAPMLILLELAVFFGKRYEKSHPETYRFKPEEPTQINCKYCKAPLTSSSFCPSCGKSQA